MPSAKHLYPPPIDSPIADDEAQTLWPDDTPPTVTKPHHPHPTKPSGIDVPPAPIAVSLSAPQSSKPVMNFETFTFKHIASSHPPRTAPSKQMPSLLLRMQSPPNRPFQDEPSSDQDDLGQSTSRPPPHSKGLSVPGPGLNLLQRISGVVPFRSPSPPRDTTDPDDSEAEGDDLQVASLLEETLPNDTSPKPSDAMSDTADPQLTRVETNDTDHSSPLHPNDLSLNTAPSQQPTEPVIHAEAVDIVVTNPAPSSAAPSPQPTPLPATSALDKEPVLPPTINIVPSQSTIPKLFQPDPFKGTRLKSPTPLELLFAEVEQEQQEWGQVCKDLNRQTVDIVHSSATKHTNLGPSTVGAEVVAAVGAKAAPNSAQEQQSTSVGPEAVGGDGDVQRVQENAGPSVSSSNASDAPSAQVQNQKRVDPPTSAGDYRRLATIMNVLKEFLRKSPPIPAAPLPPPSSTIFPPLASSSRDQPGQGVAQSIPTKTSPTPSETLQSRQPSPASGATIPRKRHHEEDAHPTATSSSQSIPSSVPVPKVAVNLTPVTSQYPAPASISGTRSATPSNHALVTTPPGHGRAMGIVYNVRTTPVLKRSPQRPKQEPVTTPPKVQLHQRVASLPSSSSLNPPGILNASRSVPPVSDARAALAPGTAHENGPGTRPAFKATSGTNDVHINKKVKIEDNSSANPLFPAGVAIPTSSTRPFVQTSSRATNMQSSVSPSTPEHAAPGGTPVPRDADTQRQRVGEPFSASSSHQNGASQAHPTPASKSVTAAGLPMAARQPVNVSAGQPKPCLPPSMQPTLEDRTTPYRNRTDMSGMNKGTNTTNPPRLPKKPTGSHQPGRSMSPDPWGLQDLRMPRQQGTPRTPAMPVHGLPVAPEHADGSVPKGALPEVSQRKRVRNESSDSAGGGTEHILKKRRDDASGRAEDISQYHANGRNQTRINSGKELPPRSRDADTQAAKRLDPGVARPKLPTEYGPEERKSERLDRGRTLEPRSFGGAQDDRYSSAPPYASYGPGPSPPNGPRRQYGPPVPAVDRRPVRYNDRSPYRRSPSPDDRRHDYRPRPSSPPPRRDPYYPPNGLPSRLDRPPYREGGSSDRYYRDQHRYLPPRSPPPDARIRKRSLTPERPRSPRRRDAPPPRTSGSHSPTARRRSLSSGPSQRTQEPKPSSSPTATSPKGAPVEVSTPQATAPAGAGLGLSVDGVAKQAQGTVLSADLASRITGMDNILSSVGGASPQRPSPTLEGRIQSPTLAQRVSEIPKNAVVVANGSAGASLAARMTDHRTAPLATRMQIETPKPTPVHVEIRPKPKNSGQGQSLLHRMGLPGR